MTLKRLLRPAVALLLVVACLLCAACSTPKVAMTVGGKDYEMGDYLAYLYCTVQPNLWFYQYYAQQMGTGILDSTEMGLTYGDSTQAITLSDYVHYSTQDAIFYQRALELMLKEEGIEWDAEELAKVEKQIKEANLTKDAFIEYGFTNERYLNAYKAISLNEMSLFNGRYNKGGTQEVPETEIRKYFDENYLSYFIIEESLVDSSGNALADAKIDGLKEIMGKVVSEFNKYEEKDKTVDNFQKLYRQYLADKEALEKKLKEEADKQKEETDKESQTGTTTTGTGTTTTAATTTKPTTTTTKPTTTTTTVATTTVTGTTGTTATGTGDKTEGDKTESTDKEEEKTLERTDTVVKELDEELLKAVQGIKEGAIDIVEYKKGGTTKTLAVIFRLDPEAQRGKDKDDKEIDYYENSRDKTLQLLKYDTFTADVEAKVKTLKASAELNDRAFKAVEMAKMLGFEA